MVKMSRFAGLRRSDDGRGQSVNLRRILEEEFGAPTISVTQHVNFVPFTDDNCDKLSVNRGTNGLRIDAIGHDKGGKPISYHRIWVPPNEYTLDMTQNADANSA